ncbi:MAG: AAA family ATPase [Candidatus Omnitrophota bacterium]|nr:AAA family ATPase [Candidatus Omnitrophota bacterium]
MKALRQWVVWRYHWREDNEQWTKPPFQVNETQAKSTDSNTWTTFPVVWQAYEQGGWDGIGFALSDAGGVGLVGIDLDHCRDADSGEIEPPALAIVREIHSYTEVSPSGTGLRILAYGQLPPHGRKRGAIEMYQGERYLTITGAHLKDTPPTIEARPTEVLALHHRVFQAKVSAATAPASEAVLSDDALLSRAFAAKNGTKLARLWQGELTGYSSHSEADLAVCSILAFWTQDARQLDRLFRRSGLFRPKWDEKHGDASYGNRTISLAKIREETWYAGRHGTSGVVGSLTPVHDAFGIEDLVDERVIWVGTIAEKALVQQAGYRSCLAVPEIPPQGGDYRAALRFLKRIEPYRAQIKKHLFLLPNTMDGRAFTQELARRLGPEFGLMPIWPSECESVEHIVTVHGIEVLQEVIEHARRLPVPDVVDLASLRQELHDLYRTGGHKQGASPGWRNLAEIYRVRPGQITLVVGQPSTGKSTFVSAILVNLVRQEQWPVTVFSPEQAPPSQYATTLLEQWTGAPFDEGPNQRMSLEDLDAGLDALHEYVTLLWPEHEQASLDFLLKLAEKEVFRRGIQGLVIDPWSEVIPVMSAGQREDQYIAASLTKIRTFARTYRVHVWLIVHPRLMQKDENKEFPVPTAYDIAGGAKWRDKADNILSLWRKLKGPEAHILQIHTQKIRFRQDGQIGRVAELYYHAASSRYSESKVGA